jgi:hypothetical protein
MFRLPKTLHIDGSAKLNNPDVISFSKLEKQFLVIEEKLDGTGVSIFFDHKLNMQMWHRGHPTIDKEFNNLNEWARIYCDNLLDILGERYILFGEYCFNKHTIFYDMLPHFFLESDIYDKEREVWLSTTARNNLLKGHNYIKQVPIIAAFKPSALEQITGLVGRSKYISTEWEKNLQLKCIMSGASFAKAIEETETSGLMEGLYIKQEDDLKVINRYKYVRYDFLQKILNSGTHLRDRVPISNMVSGISEHTDGLL